MLTLRKIVFYLFVIIYLVVCPVIILFSLGILFEPSRKAHIVETGLIHVSSLPSSAGIYVNGKSFPEKTPTVIRNLVPGIYDIKLELEAHQTWKKQVNVKKTQAVSFESVLLAPSVWMSEAVFDTEFNGLIPFRKKPVIILRKGDLVENLYYYRWGETFSGQKEVVDNIVGEDAPKLVPLLFPSQDINESEIVEIYTMPGSDHALIVAENGKSLKYLWVDLGSENPEWTDISKLFISRPDKLLWDQEEINSVYYLSGNSWSKINIKEGSVIPGILEDVKGVDLSGSKLYILSDKNEIFVEDFVFGVEYTPDKINILPKKILGENHYEMKVLDNDLILFRDDNGTVLSDQPPYEIIPGKISGMVPLDDNSKVAVWSDKKIGVLDIPDISSDDSADDSIILKWLFTDGENIRQVFWTVDGEHLLFVDGDNVDIVEAYMDADPALYKVTDIRPGTSIHYSGNLNRIFYIDKGTKELRSLNIVQE